MCSFVAQSRAFSCLHLPSPATSNAKPKICFISDEVPRGERLVSAGVLQHILPADLSSETLFEIRFFFIRNMCSVSCFIAISQNVAFTLSLFVFSHLLLPSAVKVSVKAFAISERASHTIA